MHSKVEVRKADLELIERATKAIEKYYKKGWHHVGATLRTKSVAIFTGIHLEANVGSISVCAEPIALANSIMAGETEFDTIVAVAHPNEERGRNGYEVVSPCGMCREMVTDYDPRTKVIIQENGAYEKLYMSDLLPYKYRHSG